ncbi:hypothetical protein SIL08_05610 [Scandinavium sp. V105_16]|uniref:Uncharacterized protein n=1 Tax=Scandinavium lactucae TaxID=3095028 RepID=A0AAJ2VVI5_9ENTR|nr:MULTISPECIES: hypothetical protein [unclassified Scandinavium]MDX6019765.1 hypothetical protein [Scandinavium sp. V105_16]MDX6029918.1 hypothetical protein [Scandinavium sp. V105_12]
MQIVNYFRAKCLHSSNAAFSLAMKNNKYISFAEKIISVKNENKHCDLINTHSSLRKEVLTEGKILKYEHLLEKISKIKPQPYQNSDVLNYSNHLPRMAVVKYNRNDHVYFLPYNNQPKGIAITTAKESLV